MRWLGACVVCLLACSDTPAAVDGSTDDGSIAPDSPSGLDAASDSSSDAPVADAMMGRDYSNDRSKFFGNSRCAQANVQLCEDFESGTINPMIWTVAGTMPVVDAVHAARGTKALHITKTGAGLSYIKETKTFPAQNNTYWGRVFVWFHALPTSPGMNYAHWTFVAASGTMVAGEIRLSGQLQNQKNLFGVGTDNSMGTGDWTNSDKDPNNMPLAVPLDTWLCIEWLHAGATNETRFFWDATEHPSLHTTSGLHGGNMNPYILPQFTNVWLGWQEYQASTELFELFMDEIAIDKDRIGCIL